MQDAVRHLSPILTAETWVRLKGKKQNKSNNGGENPTKSVFDFPSLAA